MPEVFNFGIRFKKITLSSNTPNYQIKLDQFGGPFDLLLFFIERDELDIYNIPITKITNEIRYTSKWKSHVACVAGAISCKILRRSCIVYGSVLTGVNT